MTDWDLLAMRLANREKSLGGGEFVTQPVGLELVLYPVCAYIFIIVIVKGDGGFNSARKA